VSVSKPLPPRAQVVIIGGGVMGCSTAYHLAHLGWTDVVVLEQGRLSGGTTWHAAGLVGPLRASESGTRLVQYSAELYARLEAETGLATGYRNTGGLVLARTPDRLTAITRTAANAVAYDLPCELISPRQAQELWPPMQVDDLLAALWLPGDGKVNPTDLTMSLAKGARNLGVVVREGVRVREILTDGEGRDRRVTGVRTDIGEIEAEYVVNCAGQWAKALGDSVDVTIPMHSAEHFYVVTEAVAGTHPDLPIMRDADGWTYFKEEVGGLVVGGFEPNAKPWVAPDQIPYPFEFALLEEDWEHFSILMDEALHRIPALEHTGIRKFYNGPESFTPDNQFLLGQTPGLRGHFVGAGFNSVGIASAGGAGRALAEWIVAGEPTSDLVAVDVRRFGPLQNDNAWLRSRVAEVLGVHYAIPWPNREFTSGRDQKHSSVHDQLVARNACFGSRNGWERPLFFAPEGQTPGIDYSWEAQNWVPWVDAEQVACRTGVAVFDQSSFSKYVVAGPVEALQQICAADVDVAVGTAVYTPWLNARGTYEADVTVTRVAPGEFLIISSAATTQRDLDWLARHLPDTAGVIDLSEDFAVFGVMGPRSRALLGELTTADLDDFDFATSREIPLAGGQVRATRMTYVGELGWELMVNVYDAPEVHRALLDAGAAPAGYYAIEGLRLEKGYRAFGRELTPDLTPVEAGLVFATALAGDKEFLGRSALEAHRAALARGGERRRIVSIRCAEPDAVLWGGELVLRDGQPTGQVTSAARGATVGAWVGLALIKAPGPVTSDWLTHGDWTVDVAGRRVPIVVGLKAPLG
jgi:glycine cleavage system aminomethyltransferase T/glycine/D-amino acid oxidase-like deaminating enzyme